MTGYDSKRQMAADKLQDPPLEWASIKAILDEYGLQAIDFVADFKAALAQPAHSEWNAALDEAAARIGEIKGFGQATQDSFAIYIKGLKK
jgi:phage-related minor tail protein